MTTSSNHTYSPALSQYMSATTEKLPAVRGISLGSDWQISANFLLQTEYQCIQTEYVYMNHLQLPAITLMPAAAIVMS